MAIQHYILGAKSELTATKDTFLDAQIIFSCEENANPNIMMPFLNKKKREKKTLNIKFYIIFNLN